MPIETWPPPPSASPATDDHTPWMTIGLGEVGVHEKPGAANEPRILEYHQRTLLRATQDSVPWCAAYVGWCLAEADIMPTHSAAARSYLKWGQPIDKPRYGCVVVLERPEAGSAAGHVGFYVGTRSLAMFDLLSGNSDNRVRVAPYPVSRVLGYRWPIGP